MPSRRERHHGSRSGKPGCDDSLRDHDAPTSRVRTLLHPRPDTDTNPSYCNTSLDHIANKIASATFEVLNAGRVKTADMGGKSLVPPSADYLFFQHAGSSTTSEFTAAVIKNLE
jgi:hypothetical protein